MFFALCCLVATISDLLPLAPRARELCCREGVTCSGHVYAATVLYVYGIGSYLSICLLGSPVLARWAHHLAVHYPALWYPPRRDICLCGRMCALCRYRNRPGTRVIRNTPYPQRRAQPGPSGAETQPRRAVALRLQGRGPAPEQLRHHAWRGGGRVGDTAWGPAVEPRGPVGCGRLAVWPCAGRRARAGQLRGDWPGRDEAQVGELLDDGPHATEELQLGERQPRSRGVLSPVGPQPEGRGVDGHPTFAVHDAADCWSRHHVEVPAWRSTVVFRYRSSKTAVLPVWDGTPSGLKWHFSSAQTTKYSVSMLCAWAKFRKTTAWHDQVWGSLFKMMIQIARSERYQIIRK